MVIRRSVRREACRFPALTPNWPSSCRLAGIPTIFPPHTPPISPIYRTHSTRMRPTATDEVAWSVSVCLCVSWLLARALQKRPNRSKWRLGRWLVGPCPNMPGSQWTKSDSQRDNTRRCGLLATWPLVAPCEHHGWSSEPPLQSCESVDCIGHDQHGQAVAIPELISGDVRRITPTTLTSHSATKTGFSVHGIRGFSPCRCPKLETVASACQ